MAKVSKAPRGRVLVTGAAGCVGHQLVRELSSRGYEVTALDMPGSMLESGQGIHPLEADLTAEGVPERAVAGADAVVHLAAVVDIAASFEVLAPINLEATKRLYQAAKAASARHFVFFSTGSAYAPSDRPLREDMPLFPSNDYVRTKIEAEQWLLAQEGGPVVNIIRPALIFGPRGKVLAASLATVPVMLKAVGGLAIPIQGGPRSNWVHGEDVARAAAFLLANPAPHGSAFNVANDDPVSVGDVFTTAFRVAGLKLLPVGVPYPTKAVKLLMPWITKDAILGPVHAAAGLIFNIATARAGVKSPLRPRLDREAFDFAVHDVIFDNSRLKAMGFSYRYPTFEEGWRATYEWYVKNRWIPGD